MAVIARPADVFTSRKRKLDLLGDIMCSDAYERKMIMVNHLGTEPHGAMAGSFMQVTVSGTLVVADGL
jgi:hypothetical protein